MSKNDHFFNALTEIVALKAQLDEERQNNRKLQDIIWSIEEDGTEEHNCAVKLRQENAQLKLQIEKLEKDFVDMKFGSIPEKPTDYPIHWGGYDTAKLISTHSHMTADFYGPCKESTDRLLKKIDDGGKEF